MVKLLKIKGRDIFQQDSILIFVSRSVKTLKFKLFCFRNETCFGAGNFCKDLFFIYLQPSVMKNSQNRAILTLPFDDVTVKTINPSFHCVSFICRSMHKLSAILLAKKN